MTVTVSQSRSAQQRQPKTRNCHFPTVFGSTKATGFNKETPRENRMSQVQILSARQKARNSNDFNTLDSGLFRPWAQWPRKPRSRPTLQHVPTNTSIASATSSKRSGHSAACSDKGCLPHTTLRHLRQTGRQDAGDSTSDERRSSMRNIRLESSWEAGI